MKKTVHFISLSIIALFSIVTVRSQTSHDSILRLAIAEKTYLNYLPVAQQPCEKVVHTAFVLGYSEKAEQASWVTYVLSKAECQGDEERSSSFYVDPKVSTKSATNQDYKGSGYDRGHLAPAGDMGYSETTMKESFYYSNMSPQTPSFNRGIWKKLESTVRTWAESYGSCLVITGPVLNDTTAKKTIGPNQVLVPKAYYKVIVRSVNNSVEAIAFLLPNEASSAALTSFVLTIDQLETITGIDFLSNVPNEAQKKLENHVTGTFWQGMETVQITPK